MDIFFDTRKYEAEYGHAPRGRGWWWFTFEGMDYSTSGTYTEAKNNCKKYIRSITPHGYVDPVYVTVET